MALAAIGVPEIVGIIVVVLVIFGAGRLAGVGKALGSGVREFREEARKPGEEEMSEVSVAVDQSEPRA
jgi:sec-independent protein translocase protein TatA